MLNQKEQYDASKFEARVCRASDIDKLKHFKYVLKSGCLRAYIKVWDCSKWKFMELQPGWDK